ERIAGAVAARPLAYWRTHLISMEAQWAIVQSLDDLARDEQALANDMLFEVSPSEDGDPMRLPRGPGQFDDAPVRTERAPKAWEHTETFLLEQGLDWDEIARLKELGAIA